jgi:hypothetical protein
MSDMQHFTGTGTVVRADGSALPGERQYSITLVPWYDPDRPLAIGSWVELREREALELEGHPLQLRLQDGRWCSFSVTDVSDTPPHQYTFVARAWPHDAAHEQPMQETFR